MGCGCKSEISKFEKYTGYHSKGESGNNKEKLGIFSKIMKFFLQLFFGIFCGAVIIVMIVPMLLYIIICLMTGRQAHFTIKNLLKKKN